MAGAEGSHGVDEVLQTVTKLQCLLKVDNDLRKGLSEVTPVLEAVKDLLSSLPSPQQLQEDLQEQPESLQRITLELQLKAEGLQRDCVTDLLDVCKSAREMGEAISTEFRRLRDQQDTISSEDFDAFICSIEVHVEIFTAFAEEFENFTSTLSSMCADADELLGELQQLQNQTTWRARKALWKNYAARGLAVIGAIGVAVVKWCNKDYASIPEKASEAYSTAHAFFVKLFGGAEQLDSAKMQLEVDKIARKVDELKELKKRLDSNVDRCHQVAQAPAVLTAALEEMLLEARSEEDRWHLRQRLRHSEQDNERLQQENEALKRELQTLNSRNH